MPMLFPNLNDQVNNCQYQVEKRQKNDYPGAVSGAFKTTFVLANNYLDILCIRPLCFSNKGQLEDFFSEFHSAILSLQAPSFKMPLKECNTSGLEDASHHF